MCKVQIWRSKTCPHRWISLTKPCGEGKNISNCPAFTNGKARPTKEACAALAPPKSCPHCDKKDEYDGNRIRMIKSLEYGVKFGEGPSRSDSGIECMCCNIM